jgi:O-antigen ligase
MTAVARAGWIVCAVAFAILLSSIVHVPHVGVLPELALIALVAAAVAHPPLAIAALVLLAPSAGVIASRFGQSGVSWAEACTCAALAGLSLDAARIRRPGASVVETPAVIFLAIVLTSLAASLGVVALRLGGSFADILWNHLAREYLIDVSSIPPLHAGLRLSEGVLLLVLASRLSMSVGQIRIVIASAVGGAVIAGLLNVQQLFTAAARGQEFWSSLQALTARVRWNVHYSDYNAAGSYFVMALALAIALACAWRGARRAAAIASAAVIAYALWLTSSRVAFLAAPMAIGGVMVLPYIAAGRARLIRLTAVAAAGVVILALIAVALPRRGTQQSSLIAADVRLGLLATSGRMIASRPIYGIGLGRFYERSGEFSSPELIAKFPVAVHENAHNNFLQVATELGLVGGAVFVWLVIAALLPLARHAARTADRFSALTLAGLGAFVLTWLGGHPLLIAEPAYVFWTLLGAAAGYAAAAVGPTPSRVSSRRVILAVIAAIVLTVPWQMRARVADAELEHVGIGVSSWWATAPDGPRYREAHGQATLFVPAGTGFKFRVNPRTDHPVTLEIKLEGRVANMVTLIPNTWNDLNFPPRTVRASRRYAPVQLRVVDDATTAIWITKIEPIK